MKCPSFSTEYHAAPREPRTSDSSVCLRQIRVRELNLAAACSSASVFLKREKSCEARMLARPAMLVAVTSGPPPPPPSPHSYIHASVSNTRLPKSAPPQLHSADCPWDRPGTQKLYPWEIFHVGLNRTPRSKPLDGMSARSV